MPEGAKKQPISSWVATLKSRDFAEVAVGYGLVLFAVWTPDPLQRYLFWITLVWVVLATIISGRDPGTLGLWHSGMWHSLWVAGVAAIAAAIAVYAAWKLHTLHPVFRTVPIGARFWGYVLWAFLQQFLLQDYFLLRLLRLLPSHTAAVLAAAIMFAAAHVPNPLLVVVTLFWGAAACSLFLRYRDLYSLGLAHGILGICLTITVPNAVHHNMRVGLGYLRFHADRGSGSLQPEQPDRIHGGVGNGGRDQTMSFSPGTAVEDPGERGQQYVAPVEVGGALVEVRKAEQDRRCEQRPTAPDAALQQILHPSAEVCLLQNRDESKDGNPGQEELP